MVNTNDVFNILTEVQTRKIKYYFSVSNAFILKFQVLCGL